MRYNRASGEIHSSLLNALVKNSSLSKMTHHVQAKNQVATSALRLYLLGAFRLERDGTLVNVPGRKARSLLAFLTLYPEQHTREQLAARFWDSSSSIEARLSLRVTLNAL